MTRAVLICAIAVAGTLTIQACGADDEGERRLPPVRAVDASGCSPVAYRGEGRPDVVIAASTVLQGQFIDHGVQISQALKLVLGERDWRAGEYGVGLQLCDETTAASSDDSDPATCRRNARAFARNRSVVAVAGPWSSTCALEMLPILNRAPGGPLAAVSGSTTYLGLTRAGPGVGPGDPARYFPTRAARLHPSGSSRRRAGRGRRRAGGTRGRPEGLRAERRPAVRVRHRGGVPRDS